MKHGWSALENPADYGVNLERQRRRQPMPRKTCPDKFPPIIASAFGDCDRNREQHSTPWLFQDRKIDSLFSFEPYSLIESQALKVLRNRVSHNQDEE
jgi:hypothetical protein